MMISVFSFAFLASDLAFAWGERGHNLTGYTAARLIHDLASEENQKTWGTFFHSRIFIFGHLNNIPDISWRDPRRPEVNALNSPTHFFDAEYALLKKPESHQLSDFLNEIRSIDVDFETHFKKVDGQPNPFTKEAKPLDAFTDVGIAPWRIGQLYGQMVAAFACAKNKETKSIPRKPGEKFVLPIESGRFVCSPERYREEDLAAAVMIAGTMGHFVSDLAQPFHNTIDYDGWNTGQGGIHAYIETFALHYLDDSLVGEMREQLRKSKRQNEIWKRLKLNPNSRIYPVQVALHLSADSYQYLDLWRKTDLKFLIVKPGEVLAPGEKANGRLPAERKMHDDKKVKAALKPIIQERLEVAATLLAFLWNQAWVEAAQPKVDDITLISVPYPTDVPFLLPPELVIEKKKIKPSQIRYLF